MKKKISIASIVELFGLFVILLLVIVVITETFVLTRGQSLRARHLTEAVTLAESVAEITSGADSPERAAELLGRMEGAQPPTVEGERVVSRVDFAGQADAGDDYTVCLTLQADTGRAGSYVSEVIEVYFAQDDGAIYTLSTGNYIRGDAP
ncbi:MAG: hypothetical protein IJ751_04285 [Oscillospiraceae bacterium]|nr:hypothetical protein [Oscillospiraceae bacterium]